MRVRHLVLERKALHNDSGWRDSDLPPRHSWIFPKTKPRRNGWAWRSINAKGDSGEYLLLLQCNPNKDNWKAWLIFQLSQGRYSLVSRLESHGDHPGLHVHTHCDRSGIEEGPSGIDGLIRIPQNSEYHRRRNAWRKNTFSEIALRHFHIEFTVGPLI
jgi:hypothetical protein